MNILFLTLIDFNSLKEPGIYQDLLYEFIKNGHNVCVISPVEKRTGRETEVIKEKNSTILKLKIGNVQKTNLIEKGISTITLESIFIKGIKKYFSKIKFDLVMYSTPPITFCKAINYVKKRDDSKTYLLLKDIFPQNAVDIGLMSTTGFKSLIHKFFRKKEKQLYALSDYIGCMSQANVNYVIKHNSEVNPKIVEICPNCIAGRDMRVNYETRNIMRKKYGIPLEKKVFVYGGNLGKPQGIAFLIECLKKSRNWGEAFFLIIGDGTEYEVLEKYFKSNVQENMKLMKRLPKEDYDCMVAACDVGMIFLDYRFTIPNFPSRLLSYMQAGLPVLACTDSNTDVGEIIVNEGFGWWCKSDSVEAFGEKVKEICQSNLKLMGEKSYRHLIENYSSEEGYKIIMKHFVKKKEGSEKNNY